MRKLARIETIRDIVPIENADNIQVAKIKGWNVVVRKDEGFEKDDIVVYYEIDSYLPIDPRYEFLRKSSYKKLDFEKTPENEGLRDEGFRLRTVRLRGVYSQGLILPLSAFEKELEGISLEVGTDLTDILDVKLYEVPVPKSLRGKIVGKFPHDIPKTEQERVQNIEDLGKYRGMEFEITEKLKGTSMTVYYNDGKFGVCSRNWELKETKNNAHWNIAQQLDLERKMQKIDRNIAIQGELVGPGIDGNILKLDLNKFFVFDVWDIDKQQYLDQKERLMIVTGLSHVPILANVIFKNDLDPILAKARGPSIVNKNVMREGVVYKAIERLDGKLPSFKVKDIKELSKEK